MLAGRVEEGAIGKVGGLPIEALMHWLCLSC